MKKLLLIIVVTIGIALTSCSKNKEFTCYCTGTLFDGTHNSSSSYKVEAKGKEEASEECGISGKEVYIDAAQITHVCKIQ